jgi:hypothetical protein
LFFEDLSNTVIKDDVFARLLTFPNVLVTGHQAFFTATALDQISNVRRRAHSHCSVSCFSYNAESSAAHAHR